MAAVGKISGVGDSNVGETGFRKSGFQVHCCWDRPTLPQYDQCAVVQAFHGPLERDLSGVKVASAVWFVGDSTEARYSSTKVAIREFVARNPSRPVGTANSCIIPPWSEMMVPSGDSPRAQSAAVASYPNSGSSLAACRMSALEPLALNSKAAVFRGVCLTVASNGVALRAQESCCCLVEQGGKLSSHE